MKSQRLFLGGEYSIDPAGLWPPARGRLPRLPSDPRRDLVFTRGGYHSLLFIIKHLLPGKTLVLLPSYLCESILVPFRQLRSPYAFYRVDKDLKIDGDDLRALLIKHRGSPLLVIDYFGFPPAPAIRDMLEKEKKAGRTIIQDRSQSSLSAFPDYGSIVFDSFRKIGPADGSKLEYEKRLLTGAPVWPEKAFWDKSAFYKTTGQMMRHCHIKYGRPPARWFINLFAKAEEAYYRNPGQPRAILGLHERLFSSLDKGMMARKRRENYGLLSQKYGEISLMPRSLPDDVAPLYFTIRHGKRDQIRGLLRKENIFTAVHWNLPPELIDGNRFDEAHKLSLLELSIPVDHRIGKSAMDHLLAKLNKYL